MFVYVRILEMFVYVRRLEMFVYVRRLLEMSNENKAPVN